VTLAYSPHNGVIPEKYQTGAVYVAGKMRGMPEYNFPLFFECEEYLSQAWPKVFNPARRDTELGFDPSGLTGNEDLAELGFDLHAAMAADLDFIINEATAICLLPGWSSSVGAQHELATAQLLGKDVFYYRPDIAPGVFSIGSPASTDSTHVHESDDETQIVDTPTGAERYFTERLSDPEYRRAYTEAEINDAAEAMTVTIPDMRDGTPIEAEIRVTSTTGGQKGQKPVQMSLVPLEALREISRVYSYGAGKYERENWRKGYEWHLAYDALQRHLMEFWNGVDFDPESGLPHLAHAAFHINTLIVFGSEQPEFDDRP
jgi:hypothetical protein